MQYRDLCGRYNFECNLNNYMPMEDIDTRKDLSNYSDEEMMLNEVIRDSHDLYFIHCCLAELAGEE